METAFLEKKGQFVTHTGHRAEAALEACELRLDAAAENTGAIGKIPGLALGPGADDFAGQQLIHEQTALKGRDLCGGNRPFEAGERKSIRPAARENASPGDHFTNAW